MGLLIAFEGVDGAGKSTQAQRLAGTLEKQGRGVTLLREPGGTGFGERLRGLLLGDDAPVVDPLVESLLFMASRRQLVREKIEPALARGHVVLLDRSFLSTWVYQGVLGGVDLEFLLDLARRVHAASWPDRILVLDLAPEVAHERRRRRGGADGFEARGDAYLERVIAAFRQAADAFPELVRLVEAGVAPERVAERCLAAVEGLLPRGVEEP